MTMTEARRLYRSALHTLTVVSLPAVITSALMIWLLSTPTTLTAVAHIAGQSYYGSADVMPALSSLFWALYVFGGLALAGILAGGLHADNC